MNKIIVAALAFLTLGGCIVVRERPVHSPHPVYTPPPPETTHTSPGWVEVRHVIYDEYYTCSPAEIHMIDTCRYPDRDLFVLLFFARMATLPLRTVFIHYDRCGRNLFTVGVRCGLAWDCYFINNIPSRSYCPAPYASLYSCYWNRRHRQFTNAELHLLIDLRIGIHYYGYSPAVYFREHQNAYSRGERHPFRAMALRDYHRSGNGGRTVAGKPVKISSRPWKTKPTKPQPVRKPTPIIKKPSGSKVPPGQSGKPSASKVPPGQSGKPSASKVPPGQSGKPSASKVPPGRSSKPSASKVPPGQSGKPSTTRVPPSQSSKPSASKVPPGRSSKSSVPKSQPRATQHPQLPQRKYERPSAPSRKVEQPKAPPPQKGSSSKEKSNQGQGQDNKKGKKK